MYMKKRDKKNLRFLLSLDEVGLRRWYGQATEDDTDYAMELLLKAAAKRAKQAIPVDPVTPVNLLH
jgi:hypothetical protein